MAIECVETQEWIEEEVSKPVEQWVEKTEQKCKKRPWWHPLKWLCWLVTSIVKVVVWVVVKVGKWVVRTVCKVVGTIVDFIVNAAQGLWNMVAGIFTWDWSRFFDGLFQLLGSALDTFLTLLRVIFLLDTLDYIITEYQRGQLRTYVRTKLGFKYSGQEFQDIIDNLRIDHGAFGYRIPMRAIRTYIDSETPSPRDPNVPNLVVLHSDDKTINLKELCGFESPDYFNEKRYKTLKKGLHASGGGGGEIDNPISEDELDTYISSRGAEGPKFIVLSMRDGVHKTKLRAAELKARELGLMPQWKEEDQEVTLARHIDHQGSTVSAAAAALVNFLADIIGRKKKVRDPMTNAIIDETEALNELCTPVAVGVFRYSGTLRGISACLQGSPCGQFAHDASGVSYIDNKPDIVWKYVPIHELGHYFGLCHVEGVERIMYTPKPGGKKLGVWDQIKISTTWWTVPKLLLLKGEPTFTLEEAMQAWDYIIEHFPARCLGSKVVTPFVP